MVVAGVIGAGEVGGAPSETPGIPGAGPAPVVAWRGGGVANGPTRLGPLLRVMSAASTMLRADGPPEPMMMPVRSFEMSPASRPASRIA